MGKIKPVNPKHTWKEKPCVKCGRVYCPCPATEEKK